VTGVASAAAETVYPRAVKLEMSNYDWKRPRVETLKQ